MKTPLDHSFLGHAKGSEVIITLRNLELPEIDLDSQLYITFTAAALLVISAQRAGPVKIMFPRGSTHAGTRYTWRPISTPIPARCNGRHQRNLASGKDTVARHISADINPQDSISIAHRAVLQRSHQDFECIRDLSSGIAT